MTILGEIAEGRATPEQLADRLRQADARIAELESARLRAETLLAVTRVLGKTLTLEDTFEAILSELAKVVPYDSCSIQVIHGDRLVIVSGQASTTSGACWASASTWTTRTTRASRWSAPSGGRSSPTCPLHAESLENGADDELFRAATGRHTLDRTSVAGRTGRARTVVQIPDVLEDRGYSPAARGGMRSRALLGVPILHDDTLVGVITAARSDPSPFTDEQVELVKTFADQAAIAIANVRLIGAVERQRSEPSRFLSPQIAALVSSDEGEVLLAGHRAHITCVLCDLRGSTAFVATAAPEEQLEVIRAYHQLLGALIPQHDGTLEHFAGDGVMVIFNDLVPMADHQLKAVRFALAAPRFAPMAAAWRKRGILLDLGIGVESGYATLGRIGFEGRYDYGALGPVTNLAARLSDAAAPGHVLVGQRVHAEIESLVDAEPVGDLELKGFARPVTAYAVRGLSGAPG